ncbi:malto-oligosyltrehalose trehalohydrolase [soil metagenome]
MPEIQDFRVWAPRPQQVDLLLSGGRSEPMERAEGGWWRLEVPVGRDERYAYSLDGGPARPDPRSPRQPDGVHGWSQRVDHDAFAWSDDGFEGVPWPRRMTYELHVGTFAPEGTFDAAAGHLGYLADLGITHLSLMPVNAFPGGRGWGYDGVGLYAVFEPYGGPDGFKRFVDAAHRAGIGVVLDVIYNHFGPSGNYLPEFGPYLTSRYMTPWGDAPNLDQADSDEVREYFLENAVMWVRDYHLDGLRLDAVDHIFDSSALPFLEELNHRVKKAKSGTTLVGETSSNDPRYFRSPERGGSGLDGIWSDEMHHALHSAATAERTGYYVDYAGVEHVAKALCRGWVFDGQYSQYRRRRHGRPAEGAMATQFMAYTQTHDQVGNRARGDRLCHQAGSGRAAAAAAVALLGPANPMVFMGEEWAASTPFQYFCDHQDEELSDAVRRGRQDEFRAFGWRPDDIPDPEAEETFLRSKLDWDEREHDGHATMRKWYQDLIALRARHVGDDPRPFCRLEDVAFDAQGEWVRFGHSGLVVLAVFAGAGGAIRLDGAAGGEPVLAWGDPQWDAGCGEIVFAKPGAAVWTGI